jgi:tetratricopeptide (TPR) repeat protein
MNKGIALWRLGHLEEGLDCLQKAIRVYWCLVKEGRREAAYGLAMALESQGDALSNSGRLIEAIYCYEEASGIYRYFVEEGWRELTNDLTWALVKKGEALRDFGYLGEAFRCYDEVIRLWEGMMAEGEVHIAPSLIRVLGIRFELKRQMRDWDGAADDVRKALACVMPFLSSGSLAEALAREFSKFLQRLRQLKEEEWTALASALGEDAEQVRQLMQSWSEDAGV